MDYIEEITRIARENIKKAIDAGCGMYNFDLWLDKPIQGTLYKDSAILQVYPFRQNGFYGLTYLLCYYPLDKEGKDWEHDDIAFNDLTDEEQEYVFNEFKKQIEGTKSMTTSKELSSFVKKGITFEEKVQLISDWEEDRGSDGEYVYDLDDDEDAKDWIEVYSAETLHKCRKEGRYWMGGWQFGCNGLNTKGNCATAWCISEEKMADFFTRQLLPEIEERYNIWISDTCPITTESKLNVSKNFGKFYHELIDFEGFCKAKTPMRYKWVAVSDDSAYEEVSVGEFDTEIDCYNNMRDHALAKMKWNTEYTDFDDNGEVIDESYINYDVNFDRDKITHLSYSGYYVYKIVPADTIINADYYSKFAKEVREENNRNDIHRTLVFRSQYEDIDKKIEVKGHSSAYNGESEWETGITREHGKYFVSVFFPNKANPSHSVSIPVEQIDTEELYRILRTLSVKNK